MNRVGLTIILTMAFMGMMIVGFSESSAADPTKRAIFKVDNLSCGSCFYTINRGLSSLEGFSGMGANLFRKMVAVDFMAPLTPEQIGQTISGLGYQASLDVVDIVNEKESFSYLNSLRKRRGSGSGCFRRGRTADTSSGNLAKRIPGKASCCSITPGGAPSPSAVTN